MRDKESRLSWAEVAHRLSSRLPPPLHITRVGHCASSPVGYCASSDKGPQESFDPYTLLYPTCTVGNPMACCLNDRPNHVTVTFAEQLRCSMLNRNHRRLNSRYPLVSKAKVTIITVSTNQIHSHF
ncbi:hypothetical protein J6590_078425 [Homalodisca vitripennis]|nr:hypothetical protein J6590_078425 [Homalodisca vitripennis]